MKTLNSKFLFVLFLLLVVIAGCKPDQPTGDINVDEAEAMTAYQVGQVVKSSQFEERVEFEEYPQNNCQGRTDTDFIVQRSRTLEQSVEVVSSGELEAAGGASLGLKADLKFQ